MNEKLKPVEVDLYSMMYDMVFGPRTAIQDLVFNLVHTRALVIDIFSCSKWQCLLRSITDCFSTAHVVELIAHPLQPFNSFSRVQ